MVAAALAVSIALAGCSGGGGGSTGVSQAGGGGQSQPGATFTGEGGQAFCELSRNYQDPARQPNATPAMLRQLYTQAQHTLQQMINTAPKELRDDVVLVAGGLSQFIAALEKANFDITKLEPESLQIFQDPRYTAASGRYTAYLSEICGIKR